MAEKISSNPNQPEALLSTEQRPEVTLAEKSVEPIQPGEVVKNVEQARSSVEKNLPKQDANPIEELEAAEKAPAATSRQQISRDLRQVSLQRELVEIRRRLPAPQRVLSRIIHQPVVRVVSEASGRTVSRPSGLLGGGLVAFVGTTGYLWLARHQGWRYNYLVFFMLLAAGFALGVLLEGLVFLTTRSRRQHQD